jgi:hypothetical protein
MKTKLFVMAAIIVAVGIGSISISTSYAQSENNKDTTAGTEGTASRTAAGRGIDNSLEGRATAEAQSEGQASDKCVQAIGEELGTCPP